MEMKLHETRGAVKIMNSVVHNDFEAPARFCRPGKIPVIGMSPKWASEDI